MEQQNQSMLSFGFKLKTNYMAVITLTSDWAINDYYIGLVKGMLLSACPQANIIDLAHGITSFNISQAAFIIRNSYHSFPENTIHIICIKSEIAENREPLLIKYQGYYFIGTDNGIFGLILNSDLPKEVYRIDGTFTEQEQIFPEYYIFAKTAAAIANNTQIEKIATKKESFYKHVPLRATIDESEITGSVIYIDSYKNAITNISRRLIQRFGNTRNFEIFIQSHHYKLTKINHSYCETTSGELLVLFNSAEVLEIAINNGNAADLLNLEVGSIIRIKFN